MKKVLIITYYWPPMGGGGVQRWLKMTKYFREFGWEPVIFTTENGEASVVDESMLAEIPKGIETLRVPIWEPFGLYKKLLGKNKDERIAPSLGQETKGNSTLHNLSIWVRGNFFIPDARMFWIKPSSKFLKKYLEENKIDAIISTGPPHSTHLIAYNATRKNNIPWVADFRDPWTNIDFYHKLMLTKWADKRHKKLEQRVLINADAVVTVSWSWAKDFEKLIDKKIEVITNGFDPDDFNQTKQVMLDKKFTITHAGSLNEDRNPTILWKVLSDLVKELDGFKNDLEIKFIGQVDISASNEIKQYGLENYFTRINHLPHHLVIKEIMKSQTLLLPLNDVPNIDGVVPGKLYEYIGAKRPIICIGKPTGDSAKIILETKAGSVTDFNDYQSLKDNIVDYYNSYKKQNLHISSEGFEKYSRKILAGSFAKKLDELITQQQ
jgi:glycosyltransferase involved in cell wall biosynthesis